MSHILDHIAPTPVLDVVEDGPRSTTRTEWFRLTRDLIQSRNGDEYINLYAYKLSLYEYSLSLEKCVKVHSAA
jgi:hypothetical protein